MIRSLVWFGVYGRLLRNWAAASWWRATKLYDISWYVSEAILVMVKKIGLVMVFHISQRFA